MTPREQEAAILESVLPQLQSEGFEVFAHPSTRMLPPFMHGYIPDAIALRGDRKLAIEVTSEASQSKERLSKIQALFSGRNDWELRVYWVSPSKGPRPVERVDRRTIDHSLASIEELSQTGKTSPALLMAWATFEAIGRALLPDAFVRPQTPGRLVEVLAAEGHLTPDEADDLRRLAELRNRLIHGGLALNVSAQDIVKFLTSLKQLAALVSSEAAQ